MISKENRRGGKAARAESAMAEEKTPKKRRGRRAYLNDFQLNENGQYIYIGRHLTYDGPVPYRRYRDLTAASAAAAAVFTVLAECLPAVGLSRAGLVMLPWAVQLAAALLLAWSAGRTVIAGNPMREYLYKKSAKDLPGRAVVTAAAACVSAVTQIIYICVKGFEGDALNTALRPVCSLGCALASVFLYRLSSRTVWKRPETGGKVPPREDDNSGNNPEAIKKEKETRT